MTIQQWESEANRLEDFFLGVKWPEGPIKLNGYTIYDGKFFMSTCLANMKRGTGVVWEEGNMIRLQQLEAYLIEQDRKRD